MKKKGVNSKQESLEKKILVERFKDNPLLKPDPNSSWMNKNVFNCGVIIDDDGLYKMLLRAAYTDNQSKSDCGLALSVEGSVWYTVKEPVLRSGSNDHCQRGIEDPRIVKWIDGWNYIFATACSAIGGRVGIWRTKNFFEYEWVGIPFNQEDKDASIFPEPINGHAYLIHRKAPDMWISHTKDLSLKTGWKDSQVLAYKEEFYKSPNTGNLPSKIGIAGPPIKTPKGWLVITHGVHGEGENEFNRVYSLGFMVLDLENPTIKNYIHQEPILWPEKWYEIGCNPPEKKDCNPCVPRKSCNITPNTVPVVAFSCATVDPGGDAIYIYYGGADKYICGGRLFKKDLPMCYD